jgi:hypothetical protein
MYAYCWKAIETPHGSAREAYVLPHDLCTHEAHYRSIRACSCYSLPTTTVRCQESRVNVHGGEEHASEERQLYFGSLVSPKNGLIYISEETTPRYTACHIDRKKRVNHAVPQCSRRSFLPVYILPKIFTNRFRLWGRTVSNMQCGSPPPGTKQSLNSFRSSGIRNPTACDYGWPENIYNVVSGYVYSVFTFPRYTAYPISRVAPVNHVVPQCPCDL